MITTKSEIETSTAQSYHYINVRAAGIVEEINKSNIDIALINTLARDIQNATSIIARDLKRYRHQKEKEARRRR